MDIFGTALWVMVTLFVLVIIFVLGVLLVGGFVKPMITHLASGGILASKTERVFGGMIVALIICLATPFIYFIVKTLYEKEDTSVYMGG